MSELQELLEDFAKLFAERDNEGNWWGYDTNLGSQKQNFNRFRKKFVAWAEMRLPAMVATTDEMSQAEAQQTVGSNRVVGEAMKKLEAEL